MFSVYDVKNSGVLNRNDQENSTRKAWVISLATKEMEGLERETTKVSSKKVRQSRICNYKSLVED